MQMVQQSWENCQKVVENSKNFGQKLFEMVEKSWMFGPKSDTNGSTKLGKLSKSGGK